MGKFAVRKSTETSVRFWYYPLYSSLAQWLEHPAYIRQVHGSSPWRTIMKLDEFRKIIIDFICDDEFDLLFITLGIYSYHKLINENEADRFPCLNIDELINIENGIKINSPYGAKKIYLRFGSDFIGCEISKQKRYVENRL